jgi:hypothetical protein
MLVCVLCTATFTSLLTSRITTGALAQPVTLNTLSDVRGTLCVTTAYPRLSAFVRASLAGRRDVRVVEDEVWACAQAVLDGRASAYISDRSLLVWFADTYESAAPLYVSPALSVNAYSLGFANGSSLRQLLNPALIATVVDPEWTPRVAEIAARFTPATSGGHAAGSGGSGDGAGTTSVNKGAAGRDCCVCSSHGRVRAGVEARARARRVRLRAGRGRRIRRGCNRHRRRGRRHRGHGGQL